MPFDESRRRSTKRRLGILFILLLLVFPASAQEKRTVGVLVNTEAAYEGYTLFSPSNTPSVYLIDNEGRIIHTWEIENTESVMEAHLRENGNLVVVAGPRDTPNTPNKVQHMGSIREYTWNNRFVWEYHHQFAARGLDQHHAIDILPNGNILAIAWNRRPMNEAAAMGLRPAFSAALQKRPLLVEIIVEIDPATNKIVWQWDTWDHLAQDFDADLPNYGEIAQRPHRIDINYQPRIGDMSRPYDWLHANTVHYHPELDQIVISVREFNEFWIIDHSASTTEAAGDLLWRWGNPAAYQQGDPAADRQLFLQHDVQWIADGLPGAGNILIFNNQHISADGEKYSSALELKPPLRPDGSYDWQQDVEIVWSYAADGFYSATLSGVQRLPNGNTLITEGRQGRLIEVSADGEVVWEFVNPVTAKGLVKQGDPPNPPGVHFSQRNNLFRVRKYSPDHPAFAGRDMTPGDRLAH